MTNPSIATLCDYFTQGAVNTNLWGNPYISDTSSAGSLGSISTATVSVSFNLPGPAVATSIPASVVVPVVSCNGGVGVGSLIPYDLTGNGISVRVGNFHGDWGGSVQYHGFFQLGNNSASGNFLGWDLYSTASMEAVVWSGGGRTSHASLTYSPSTTQFLRVRESSGSIYWDYSGDGLTWTNLTSTSNPFAVTGLYVNLYDNYTVGSGVTGAISWASVDYVL